MYRISWCVKNVGKYYTGSWQEEEELNKLQDWCIKQNMNDGNSYYWIEEKSEDGKVKNKVTEDTLVREEFINISVKDE